MWTVSNSSQWWANPKSNLTFQVQNLQNTISQIFSSQISNLGQISCLRTCTAYISCSIHLLCGGFSMKKCPITLRFPSKLSLSLPSAVMFTFASFTTWSVMTASAPGLLPWYLVPNHQTLNQISKSPKWNQILNRSDPNRILNNQIESREAI